MGEFYPFVSESKVTLSHLPIMLVVIRPVVYNYGI